MGALRITGAAVLIAGLVGIVLYVVWAIDYSYGMAGVFSQGLNTPPLLYFAAYGLFWGLGVLFFGMYLLSEASEETPTSF